MIDNIIPHIITLQEILLMEKYSRKNNVNSPSYNSLFKNNITTKIVAPEGHDKYTNSILYPYNTYICKLIRLLI